MNRAKALGRKIVKARSTQQSSGPAAPGSPMGFGPGYKKTYAQTHVHGKPSQTLRRYRRSKRIQREYDSSRVT